MARLRIVREGHQFQGVVFPDPDQRLPEPVPEEPPGRAASEAGNSAGVLLAGLDSERINGAIAVLPEEYRVVAALYFLEDLSYQDIAEMIGVPIGTVRSRLFRARRQLQRALWDAALDLGLVTEQEETP